MIRPRPMQNLHRLAIVEAFAADGAGLLREERRDRARAIERAQKTVLLQPHAVELRGGGVLDHAGAAAALLLHREAQVGAQPRAHPLGFADRQIFRGAIHYQRRVVTSQSHSRWPRIQPSGR